MTALHKTQLDDLVETISGAAHHVAAVAAINTMVRNAEGYHPAQVRTVLEDALTREVRSKTQRRAVIQALKSALKKVIHNPESDAPNDKKKWVHPLSKIRDGQSGKAAASTGKEPPPATLRRNQETGLVEVIDPWDRPRRILDGIKLCVRLSIAGQVLLGHELATLKKDMGFHPGRPKFNSDKMSELSKTWPQLIEKNLKISYKTADRMIACFEAAKARLKKLGHLKNLPSGSKKLELLFTARPDSMTDDDRDALAKCVDKLVDGDTQSDLLKELKIIKFHVPLAGGDTSKHKKVTEQQMMAQLAFNFFSPIAQGLQRLRVDNDREAFLHALDIQSSDEDAITLTTLERDLEAALNDVRTAKKARMKVATGKVIESKA